MRLFLFGFFGYYVCMISKEEIEHLKDLARVEFGEVETKKLAKDLGEILGYVEQLKEVDVSNAQEMTHSVDLKNVVRKDEDGTHPLTPSPREGEVGRVTDLIDSFPEKHDAGHGTYLKVKSIL